MNRLTLKQWSATVALGGMICIMGTAYGQDEPTAPSDAAVSAKADQSVRHYNKGVALYAEGHLADAIAEYRTAIHLDPANAEAHANLGLALRAGGQGAEVARELRTALKLDPTLAEAHNTLGAVLYQRGKYALAQAEFGSAVHLKPDYALARYNLGLALAKQRKIIPATAALREAVRQMPGSPDMHMSLGDTLNAAGDKAGARAEWQKAASLGQGAMAKRAKRRLAKPVSTTR